MTADSVAPAPSWRPFGSAAYFLAGLLVLAPAIAFMFGTWPPNPTLMSWRHVSSGMVIASSPMVGSALVVILLAAKVRQDLAILRLLRLFGLIAFVAAVPLTVLYAIDSLAIYRGLAVPEAKRWFVMEVRMFTLLTTGVVMLWLLRLAAQETVRGDGTLHS